MKGNCKELNKISHKETLLIYNVLRDLGLKASTRGTTLINKAIQFVVINEDDFIVIDDIYQLVADFYQNISVMQVQAYINYAIKHRNETKCENNFSKIFGFTYDEYFFSNKNLIEEIANIIRIKTMNM